jgi:hypothetical protein
MAASKAKTVPISTRRGMDGGMSGFTMMTSMSSGPSGAVKSIAAGPRLLQGKDYMNAIAETVGDHFHSRDWAALMCVFMGGLYERLMG